MAQQILQENLHGQRDSLLGVGAGYGQTLEEVYKVMEAANTAETTVKRLNVAREFQAFLSCLPPPLSKRLEDAGPEDVLVFVEAVWSKQHAASYLPGQDRPVASPQGVNGALSFLRTTFDMLGRKGPYQAISRTGNPCESEAVHRYC